MTHDEKRSIMISCGVFHPHAGGAESLFRDLARRLVGEGHRVTVVTRRLEGTPPSESLDGFQIHRFVYPLQYHRFRLSSDLLRRSPSILVRLAGMIRGAEVRTVCLGLVDMSAHYFLLLKPFLRFRLVTYLHGGEVRDLPADSASFRRLVARVLRASDAVVAVSGDLAADAARLCPDVTPKVSVIPNGLDLSSIDAAPAWKRARAYVLFVGRLAPDKNPGDVLRGFARASPRLGDIDLVLAGTGPLEGEMRALAMELGVEARVEFCGQLDREDVFSALKGASLVVSASPAEGHPIALIEALAAGVPVVAPRVTGVVDVVEDGVTGALYPPGDLEAFADRMCRYARDGAARDDLVANLARRDRSLDDIGTGLPRHIRVLEGA